VGSVSRNPVSEELSLHRDAITFEALRISPILFLIFCCYAFIATPIMIVSMWVVIIYMQPINGRAKRVAQDERLI
jgi:hypothetical protein